MIRKNEIAFKKVFDIDQDVIENNVNHAQKHKKAANAEINKMGKSIIDSKKYCAIVIFVFALLFRIILVNAYQVNVIAPDSVGYHALGVNLARGNGLSLKQEKPFEKSYFREPGYPAFLGISYAIYEIFGGKINYITSREPKTHRYDSPSHPEIVYIKYVQAFIDSLSVVVFYLILSLVFKNSFAFVIALLYCLFYPVAIHSVYILRETMQLFIVLCMAYFFALFLMKKHLGWLALFSGFWALSNMTFRITVVVSFFMFILIWVFYKSIAKAAVAVMASTAMMLIVALPWLIRVYNYYPDIKIVKTFGCSYTLELLDYCNALEKLYLNKKITLREYDRMVGMEAKLDSHGQFQKSFDGTYNNFVRSVRKMDLPHPTIGEMSKKTMIYFYKAWFKTKISFIGTCELIKRNPFGYSIMILVPILIGLFAFLGIIVFIKKIYPVLLIFFTFIPFFYFISNEYRRMLPAQPFIFLLGCLGMYFFYRKVLKKKNDYYGILNESEHK